MQEKTNNPVIPSRGTLRWEVWWYLGLMLIALLLRLWELDLRAMHYDEAIHAMYSWQFFKGMGYLHSPWTHGPLQFYLMALLYFIFGASEFVSRLLPVIFGTLLVGLPYFLRDRLGKIGSCLAALFLAVSPSILYFSRFARDDIYVLVWDMLLLILFWKYTEKHKDIYLYLSCAVWALFFATMETSYIMLAIFCSFIFFKAAKEVIAQRPVKFDIFRTPGVFLTYLLLIVTITLPLTIPVITVPLSWLHVDIPPWTQQEGLIESAYGLVIVCIVVAFTFSIFFGLYWRWRLWLTAAGIFWGIYFLFFTRFFTNIKGGIVSGIWGSFVYWRGVHKSNTLFEPAFYYPVLMLFYEFLPLITGIAGIVYFWKKRDSFSRFLIYWALVNSFIYCNTGEKPPWLVLHVALPFILLGAKFLGEIFSSFTARPRKITPAGGIWAGLFIILLAFTIIVSLRANYRDFLQPVEMLEYSQGAQEVKQFTQEVNEFAGQRGGVKGFTISVDYTLPASWLCGWYFREYDIDWIANLASVNTPPKGAVLILHARNEEQIKVYLEKYGEGKSIHWLMWFPPFEKISFLDALLALTNPQVLKNGWMYFWYRLPWADYIFEDAMVYFVK